LTVSYINIRKAIFLARNCQKMTVLYKKISGFDKNQSLITHLLGGKFLAEKSFLE